MSIFVSCVRLCRGTIKMNCLRLSMCLFVCANCGLLVQYPAPQVIWLSSKWYSWCILGICQTSLKVTDLDLILTLEGLLARYKVHKSSDQLQSWTVDVFWDCIRQVWRSLDLFLTYFLRSSKALEGLLATYQLLKSSNQLHNGTVGACVECLRQVKIQWPSLCFPLEKMFVKGGGHRSLCSCNNRSMG